MLDNVSVASCPAGNEQIIHVEHKALPVTLKLHQKLHQSPLRLHPLPARRVLHS
jgi:hypothetical protein